MTEKREAHTPGPWRVDVTGLRDHNIVGPKGEDIGYLYATDGADDPEQYPVEANARLMASAPDMLAALKLAAELIPQPTVEMMCHRFICSAEECWRCSRSAVIYAAIAKAEGTNGETR